MGPSCAAEVPIISLKEYFKTFGLYLTRFKVLAILQWVVRWSPIWICKTFCQVVCFFFLHSLARLQFRLLAY